MPDPPEMPADAPREGLPTASPEVETPEVTVDTLSAMTPRFNFLFGWFARRYFRHFELDAKTVERLRALEQRGSVIYVMRYASRLDYFLFNTLFVREGLALSRFANGILFHYYRPILEMLRAVFTRPRGVPANVEHERALSEARELVKAGQPIFLFLRTATLPTWLRSRRGAVERSRSELDLVEEIITAIWDTDRDLHVVPLALFWRKGPRSRRSFLNLSYGASTRPSDIAKVVSFLTTYRGLSVKVGEPIDLRRFIASRRDDGPATVARKVRRVILTFLYREEKVVEGPTLRPRYKVQERVLSAPNVAAAIRERAEERRIPVEKARADANRIFREIAANMNSMFLAILNALVSAVVNRLFVSVDVTGIEKVAEYAKRHPLVLAPSHRSYFDFLIVSTLFYRSYLVPPHIAARENMAFGPFGFLWRRVGAFFLRRSFDDPLYKQVFRAYVGYLIKEGFTQEFFIEGGRSRTGKTLAPRLGMLSWDVEGFLDSARQDLFFVPIAITYERLVEEGAMLGELHGVAKSDESVMGLVRARKYLQRRFGSVHVNFGEPISLADALGDRRERFARDSSEDPDAEKRRFIESLGNRIAERINWAVVPNSTSIAACALLGERRRGMFRGDLTQRMQEIVDLLRLQDVRLTPALARGEGSYDEAIDSLLRTDLVRKNVDPGGEIVYFEEGKRRALDLYRNVIVHYLAAPSFIARRLLTGPSLGDLREDVSEWLDLFYSEFYVSRGEVLAAHLEAFLDHFERFGWVERSEKHLRATEKGRDHFLFLAEQTRGVVEAYYAAFGAVLVSDGPLTAKGLQEAASAQFDRADLLGEVVRREAANRITFGNAIELLVRRQILERAASADRKGDSAYVRGPAFDDLATLHERLATALAAG
jgi:glycerol-3-phosphate O-acyltransferase